MATPGREPAAADEQAESTATGGFVSPAAGAALPRAQRYIAALGGASNLTVVDACTTRLRLSVVDPNKVSESELKTIGARGVLKRGATGRHRASKNLYLQVRAKNTGSWLLAVSPCPAGL